MIPNKIQVNDFGSKIWFWFEPCNIRAGGTSVAGMAAAIPNFESLLIVAIPKFERLTISCHT